MRTRWGALQTGLSLLARPSTGAVQRRGAHGPQPRPWSVREEDQKWIEASRTLVRHHLSSSPGADIAQNARVYQPLQSAIQGWDRTLSLVSELRKITETDPDHELRQIAHSELDELSIAVSDSLQSIKRNLFQIVLPEPSSFQNSALVEIKPGIGGVEASHFATSLMQLYNRLAIRHRWNVKPVNVDYMTSGQGHDGLREATLEIEGENVYGNMRWEAGVHRVQRVPVMQNTSSVHTSTAAVIVTLGLISASHELSLIPGSMLFHLPPKVLPLSPSNPNHLEDDFFDEKDVKIETMRSQGAGGQ